MPALLGVDPLRPPPAERKRIAVDYHRWHLDMVEAESLEQAARLEAARGVCDLVVPTRRARKAGDGDRQTVPRRQRDMSDPLERGKALLVSARAATWAALDQMTEQEIRAALEDLQRRIRTQEQLQRVRDPAADGDDASRG
ncbi:MAG: hypothetical protein ABFD77_00110 [Thermotogota bacterium]